LLGLPVVGEMWYLAMEVSCGSWCRLI